MKGALPLRPILSSLRRHRLTVYLLVFQVALTCAVVPNAIFIIQQRISRVHVASGLAEDRLTVIRVQSIRKDDNHLARVSSDLAALRNLPGVTSAAAIGGGLPLDGGANTYGICPDLAAVRRAMAAHSLSGGNCVQPQVYSGTPGFMETLGVRLVAGREFTRDEYVAGDVATAIITRSLADHLYPSGALGRVMYAGPRQIRVVGVASDTVGEQLAGGASDAFAMFWPKLPDAGNATYVINSDPVDRQRLLADATRTLAKLDARRLMPKERQQTYASIRNDYFSRDMTMAGMLAAVSCGLLFMTALGISGLASFWVQQRWRFIGVRRALGASRAHVVSYFQAENFLIVMAGITVGTLGAWGLNALLASYYEVSRLPPAYVLAGASALFMLGQLAVLGPALRASAIPPAAATRGLQ